MKRVFAALLTILLTSTGCAKQQGSEKDIVVGSPLSSYAMFGAEQHIIDYILAQYSTLEFKKTDRELDLLNTFMVSITADGKTLARFSVDKTLIFWIDGTATPYAVSSGTFDYVYLKNAFEENRRKDGPKI
jgi:hypothetical protein